LTWLPVIESDLGQERFLVEDPNESFRAGRFEKVNVMIGLTADEFIAPAESKFN
jgi:acetylcholinesterase